MKKVIFLMLAMVLVGSVAFAAVSVQDDSANIGAFRKLNFKGTNVTDSDGILDIDLATPTFTSATVTTGTIENLTASDNVMTLLGVTLTESGGVLYANGKAM